MDIAVRLTLNEQKIQTTTARLQQMEQEKQNLLQELLRLDGEHRLLMELQNEVKKKEKE
jgi:hypothetical protein